MVAKITTGKDIYGALFYNQEKVNQMQGVVLSTHIIREPEDGDFNVMETSEEFLRWMPNHYRTEKPVLHISLNPHIDDKLSDDQLSEIAEKYMQRMGYGEQPYMVFKHTDIEREHIHIVSLQVDSTGKKINDSKRNLRSVAITEELEQEYGLNPAKGQEKKEHWQLIPIDPTLGNLKKQIAGIVKPASKMYQFQTMGEFRALLSFYNIGIEEVEGTRKGKAYKGLLYTVLDKEGNRTATAIKSSLLGKDFGLDALEKHMRLSSEKIKQGSVRESTRKRVAEAFANTSSESEFREKLHKQNIDLFLRKNDIGRIVGVTFIDHKGRCVLNGSRLGKGFSANGVNERFSQKKGEAILTTRKEILSKQNTTRQEGSKL